MKKDRDVWPLFWGKTHQSLLLKSLAWRVKLLSVPAVAGRVSFRKLLKRLEEGCLAANTTLRIERILHGNTVFTVHPPIHPTVSEDGPYCLVEFETLSLQGLGRDEQEAIESFAGQFCGMWEWIASAHNLDLTSDARRLKRKMLSLVKSVTPPASA